MSAQLLNNEHVFLTPLLLERIADMGRRYPQISEFIEEVLPKIKAIENEIFNIIGMDKELREIN